MHHQTIQGMPELLTCRVSRVRRASRNPRPCPCGLPMLLTRHEIPLNMPPRPLEFSTSRKPSGTKRNDVKDISSDALFYVSGRTPLHLRLELYDTFDGVDWHAEPDPSPSETPAMTMVKESGRDWLRLPDRSKSWEFLGPAEMHAVKIVQLDTNVIPAPLHLHGVHIADVDRLDMYKPGPSGLVRMDREKLAELVPIHLASRTIHHARLNQEAWSGHEQRYTEVPESLQSKLTEIAQAWGRRFSAWLGANRNDHSSSA